MTRSLYIPHGGGPLPLMDDPAHVNMIPYLRGLGAELGQPSAIVVVSAHWESPTPAITAAPNPDLNFDYYGFPPETYELKYPAPGSPELAERLGELVATGGFEPRLDTERGFDHGMFVPLMLMYPDANIPVIQLSLIDGLDPAAHIELGEAISPLIDEDVLVLGSGMSFHNMQGFSRSGGPDATDPDNIAFDSWLENVCAGDDLDAAGRRAQLIDWTQAPAANYNHPREEHLIPLHVCFGAAGGTQATRTFDAVALGKRVAAYAWS